MTEVNAKKIIDQSNVLFVANSVGLIKLDNLTHLTHMTQYESNRNLLQID